MWLPAVAKAEWEMTMKDASPRFALFFIRRYSKL
jgi:hypothetical protein